jgi:cyclic beta-1,2-glucan synthetase
VQIDEPDDVGIVRQLLRAHEYWRLKQLPVDLVILNERAPSYVQDLQSLLETLVRTSQSAAAHDGHAPHGSVFILRSDRITPGQRDALLSAARAVLSNRRGTLAEQIAREPRVETPPVAAQRRPSPPRASADPPMPPLELELFNGLGGFAADGREYVTRLGRASRRRRPGSMSANPVFGFQVSELARLPGRAIAA